MADLNVIARVAALTTGTSVLTAIQIVTPANQRIKVKEIGVGFHGVVATDAPITVDLLLQTTAGTSSSLTLGKEDSSAAETIQSTALQTFSGEPTAGTIIRTWSVHPQTGMVLILPPGAEIKVGGGKKLGLRVTAGVSTTCDAYIRFEE